MNDNNYSLYLEINKTKFIFFAIDENEEEKFETLYNLEVPIDGFENNRIANYEKVLRLIKENIFLIEKKLNYTFKEIRLILDNFNPSFLNISGFKKLNGSQILKENITYILNTLKLYVNKTEEKKTIIHIFNSKFFLDNKKIDNLPVGLFGDFYAHELSFALINTNDYKNLKNIFDNCNLKIDKTLLKSFIKGAYISDININLETFLNIEINHNTSKIFYFENNSLKFEQSFDFGLNIIIKDIAKITLLKKSNVEKILNEIKIDNDINDDELIEKEFFINENFRKIKKKLIYEIALARVKEISEIMFFKNINFYCQRHSINPIFLEINSELKFTSLKKICQKIFSSQNKSNTQLLENDLGNNMMKILDKLVHFGWKKEAIPISKIKKSIIARFFEAIFD